MNICSPNLIVHVSRWWRSPLVADATNENGGAGVNIPLYPDVRHEWMINSEIYWWTRTRSDEKLYGYKIHMEFKALR